MVVDDLVSTGMYLPISSGESLFARTYEQGLLPKGMSCQPTVNDGKTGYVTNAVPGFTRGDGMAGYERSG